MSVFIRPDTKTGEYSYDFRLGGRRFSGRTGTSSRREAIAVERQRRAEARLELAAEAALEEPRLTLEAAFARYWQEKGQHRADSASRLRDLAWLQDHFGAARRLDTIGDDEVARMVAKRRGEKVPNGRKGKRVSNATVNRTALEPLKDVWFRARHVWKRATADIEWKLHRLPEPLERTREASAAEEAALRTELSDGYREALDFAFLTGCRRMEIIGLRWRDVDFFGRRFTVEGKGARQRIVPMSAAIFDLLWRLRGHHPEHVFTYVARRTMKKRGIVRGRRYPLTESGLKSAARRGFEKSGVANFRFHDTRHTAGTRALRASNLRVVQKLLGHADPKTTAKYAHAMQEDIRAALDAMSATENATAEMRGEANALTQKRKAD